MRTTSDPVLVDVSSQEPQLTRAEINEIFARQRTRRGVSKAWFVLALGPRESR